MKGFTVGKLIWFVTKRWSEEKRGLEWANGYVVVGDQVVFFHFFSSMSEQRDWRIRRTRQTTFWFGEVPGQQAEVGHVSLEFDEFERLILNARVPNQYPYDEIVREFLPGISLETEEYGSSDLLPSTLVARGLQYLRVYDDQFDRERVPNFDKVVEFVLGHPAD
jgi:hypothetical protein